MIIMIRIDESLDKNVQLVLSDFSGRYIFNPLNIDQKYKIIQISNNGDLYLKDKNQILFKSTLTKFKNYHIL